MVAPGIEDIGGSAAGPMIAGLAGLPVRTAAVAQFEIAKDSRAPRRLAIYPASAGFDLVDELDHLSARTIEPNVFFNPRFLAPAMPRLEDREIRLAVMRDGGDERSRLRLLMPFSIEKPPVPVGVSIIRAWSSPFGPLGTPLIDRDDPIGVLEDFLALLARPKLKLPRVLVLPDMRLDGPVAQLVRTVALGRDLALATANATVRPFLRSDLDPESYLKNSLSAHHLRGFRRLKRRLAEKGEVGYHVARQAAEIRHGVEEFLALESKGWKGVKRTAMASDRYRAAFAREAVHRLAEQDLCRVHSLTLDGRVIACLIVFVENGCAYTWKTAYDEEYAAFSPGALLAIEATATHLDDPNIEATDSCAVADHPVMSRLWSERRDVGTLLIGLTSGADRAVRQATAQLHLYQNTRDLARRLRRRLHGLLRRR
jgi:hypothetical protein